MTKIIIVLNEKGQFENVLSNNEIDLNVLKRGIDDDKIDESESNFDVIEF